MRSVYLTFLVVLDIYVVLRVLAAEAVRRYHWRILVRIHRDFAQRKINEGQMTVLLNDLLDAKEPREIREIEVFLDNAEASND